jgi:hypothetical protein
MHVNQRASRLLSLALIPIAVGAALSGLYQDGFYQRVSHLLLTTASVEAAANGGAIGENLPQP